MFNPLVLLAQTQAPPEGAPSWAPFLPMFAIIAAFFLLIILPRQRQEKRHREELFTKLKKNDEVLTSSGIIGIVANIKDDEVTLKIDESSNAKLRVLKSSLVRILNPKDAPATTDNAQNIKAGAPAPK